jgi:ubiquinone/menaquinone biosynthesis C-methylase UbiE
VASFSAIDLVSSISNQCAGPFGAAYDFYIERPWLMRALGRLVWGIDLSALYRSIDTTVARLGGGATVIDVPCGGGVAFRALSADQDVRYIAADLSEKMLARARRRAERRALGQVELVTADMLALPFADGQADVIISYSGLHMLGEPQLAVEELVRCLKPGGELIGTTFLREGSRRQRLLFGIGHRRGHALPPRAHELRRWLEQAGIEQLRLDPQEGFAVFAGRKRR